MRKAILLAFAIVLGAVSSNIAWVAVEKGGDTMVISTDLIAVEKGGDPMIVKQV